MPRDSLRSVSQGFFFSSIVLFCFTVRLRGPLSLFVRQQFQGNDATDGELKVIATDATEASATTTTKKLRCSLRQFRSTRQRTAKIGDKKKRQEKMTEKTVKL